MYSTEKRSCHEMNYKLILLCICLLLCEISSAQQVGQPLPNWQAGYLDIHHINTGHGDAAFYIFPDGTTMLLDAGEMDPNSPRINSPRNATLHPNNSKRAYEWIADYIKNFHPTPSNPVIDYSVITHFHDDHFGSYYAGAITARIIPEVSVVNP